MSHHHILAMKYHLWCREFLLSVLINVHHVLLVSLASAMALHATQPAVQQSQAPHRLVVGKLKISLPEHHHHAVVAVRQLLVVIFMAIPLRPHHVSVNFPECLSHLEAQTVQLVRVQVIR